MNLPLQGRDGKGVWDLKGLKQEKADHASPPEKSFLLWKPYYPAMKEKLRIPQRILAINTNNKLVLVLLTVSLRKDCKTVAGAL